MSPREFSVRTTVAADPEVALDFLMDLERHRGLHPYLVSADVVDEGTDAGGPWRDYRVMERPRLGPLRYSVTFAVRLHRPGPGRLVSRVRVAFGGQMSATTTAERLAPEVTELRERCVVHAPWWLLAYMTRSARGAHEQTYRRLSGVLDG